MQGENSYRQQESNYCQSDFIHSSTPGPIAARTFATGQGSAYNFFLISHFPGWDDTATHPRMCLSARTWTHSPACHSFKQNCVTMSLGVVLYSVKEFYRAAVILKVPLVRQALETFFKVTV